MKRSLLVVALFALMVCAANTDVFAQEGKISIYTVDSLIGGDTVQAGLPVRFLLKFNNDTPARTNVSSGWKISSPDGAVWDSTTLDTVGPNSVDLENVFGLYFDVIFSITPTEVPDSGEYQDTVGVLGAGNPTKATKQLPIGFNDSALAITVWFHDKTSFDKHICIDSSFWGSGGTWVWVGRDLVDRHPEWIGLYPGQPYSQGISNGTDSSRVGSGYCFLLWDAVLDVDQADNGSLPKEFKVSQNYPNPFNPDTKINYEVPRKAKVNLSVYNVLGQKVVTLVDREMAPGRYSADWNGTGANGGQVASGIYFYKFEAGNFVQTKKMVLMK